MVIADIKTLEEIMAMLHGCGRVLTVGCGGCVSVCLAGGQKEVDGLNLKLTLARKAQGAPLKIDGTTIERQCETVFLAALDDVVSGYDALLSMACGAGVQFLAERYPHLPVFPAVNSVFVGVHKEIGWYEERCRCCGDCVLGITAGICPVTMCAKSLLNGPCGGPRDGCCEVDKDRPCAWVAIYERLKAQCRLANFAAVQPARQWRDQVQGRLLIEGYGSRFVRSGGAGM